MSGNTKRKNNAATQKQNRRRQWLFLASVAAALAVASVMIALSLLRAGPTQTSPPTLPSSDLSRGTELGAVSAPVLIEEFSDFQCPFCAKFARETLPVLAIEFVATGKVRLVFREFPFSGQESVWAAEAALAAADQGKFWEYHNLLYSRFVVENKGTFTPERLKSYARELGLDERRFNADLDSEKYLGKVRDDLAQGMALDVTKTPTFFINGVKVFGAISIEDFRRLIKAALEDN